jgi:hypothetical protein
MRARPEDLSGLSLIQPERPVKELETRQRNAAVTPKRVTLGRLTVTIRHNKVRSGKWIPRTGQSHFWPQIKSGPLPAP